MNLDEKYIVDVHRKAIFQNLLQTAVIFKIINCLSAKKKGAS